MIMDKKDKEKEPELDLEQLSEEDKEEYKRLNRFPIGWAIFFGIMTLLIIGCVIVIFALR